MTDESFYDTNILFYSYDLNEPQKRKICRARIGRIFSGADRGYISNQILVELYNALTRKLGVKAGTSRVIVGSFISSPNWVKINYNHGTAKRALETSNAFKTSFLDTLIVETMKENGLNKIITENERDFKPIPGVQVINPMKSTTSH